jgi:hypothetical protein
MGRLVGLSYFSSSDALAEEKADASEIRRARGQASDDVDSSDSITSCQRQIATKMQLRFGNRNLRRTPNSLDWQKNRLITLPPLEEFVFIDGQTSFQKRAKIVDTFNKDPTFRVLIISSVGSNGLNLTVASSIIFIVSCHIPCCNASRY